jgi:hypothetical protein
LNMSTMSKPDAFPAAGYGYGYGYGYEAYR